MALDSGWSSLSWNKYGLHVIPSVSLNQTVMIREAASDGVLFSTYSEVPKATDWVKLRLVKEAFLNLSMEKIKARGEAMDGMKQKNRAIGQT